MPDVDDRLDEHEQPDEEEQGVPLDVAQRLVRVERTDDHQDGGAEQRDRRGLEPEHGVEEEADERQDEDDQRPDHQRPILDRRRRVHRRQDVQPVGVVLHPPAEGEPHDPDEGDHDHDDDRREIDEEVAEVEPGGRADEDVGRVADQGRGAADVRGEDLADQVREGRDLEGPRDRERHRREQHHRRHVVEDGRQDGGQEREDDQQPEGLTSREVDRVAGHVLEEAGLAEPTGQDHHPGQQEDDVEVDRREGFFLVDDPEDDDEQAAQQRDEGPVEAL